MSQKTRSGWTPETADDQVDADFETDEQHPGVDAETSIIALVQRVANEGRAYAETEIERQRLRASILGAAGRDTALLVLGALFLLFGTLTALLVGCVWMLAPIIGIFGALALTMLAAFAIIFLLLLAAKARISKAIRTAFGKGQTP